MRKRYVLPGKRPLTVPAVLPGAKSRVIVDVEPRMPYETVKPTRTPAPTVSSGFIGFDWLLREFYEVQLGSTGLWPTTNQV